MQFTGRSLVCFHFLVAILPLIAAHACHADDWSQWRGPSRAGYAAESPVWPDGIGEERLVEQWQVSLGPSYSGPIIVGDRVFTTETKDAKTEVAYAFDRRTGDELWQREWEGSLKVPFFAAANGSWIRATPACDGQRLYVAGIRDVVVALDVATGEELWRVDLAAKYNTQPPAFGFVSSPLLVGDHLYVQAAESLIKLDKLTGVVAWRSAIETGAMNSAFSSPIIATIAGREQVVVQTRAALKGIDPATGAELWSQPIQAFQGMNILTPTVYGDTLFTSAHSGKSQLWRLEAKDDATEVAEAWSNSAQAYMSSPIVIGDYAYLHLRNQRVCCVDLRTGEEQWRSTPYGKYWSMIAQGEKILALDERGDLLLIRANPEKFELLATRHLSDSQCWAHLAVSDGQMFVRTLDSLIAYEWK